MTEDTQTTGRVVDGVSIVQQQLIQLKQQLEDEKREVAAKFDPEKIMVDSIKIPPRKSDISVEHIALVWWPN
jgi:hypothetical protein